MATLTYTNAAPSNYAPSMIFGFGPVKVSSSSTHLTYSVSANGVTHQVTFLGTNFAFSPPDSDFPTSGTVQSIEWRSGNGATLFGTIAGLDLNLQSALFAWKSGSGSGDNLWFNFLFPGDDTLTGGTADDEVHAGNGNDSLDGGDGWDFLVPGRGADTIHGGNGIDTLNYGDNAGDPAITRGISITLGDGTVVDPWGFTDTFTSIERVRGTRFRDTMNGDGADNRFEGMGGSDFINGGEGFDTVRYQREALFGGTQGVNVNLAAGTAIDGFGQLDLLTSIEGVIGTDVADKIVGSAVANRLEGLEGNDSIAGREGNDTLLGGGGTDTVDGGADNDLVQGGLGNDLLYGGAGNDTLQGNNGNFGFSTPTENDTLYGGDGNDQVFGESGNDWLYGGAGDDLLAGGAGADRMYGDGGDDTFNPADNESDTMYGGDGFDAVAYDPNSNVAVVVDLRVNTATNANGVVDYLYGIEIVQGTAGNDRFYGTEADDWFRAGRGSDTLYGGDGAGADLVDYRNAAGAVRVELGQSYVWEYDTQGNVVSTDFIFGFERALGSRFDDRFYGTAGENEFRASLGNDIYQGLDGVDTLRYGSLGRHFNVQVEGFTIDLRNPTDIVTKRYIDGGVSQVRTDFVTGVERIIGSLAADTVLGGAADDYLDGGGFTDILTGGGGADTFVLSGIVAGGSDRLTDFTSSQGDKVHLVQGAYGTYVVGDTINLFVGSETMFQTSDEIFGSYQGQGFAYDRLNGFLYFDADGSGQASTAAVIAQFGLDGFGAPFHPVLSASDFVVVA